MKIGQNLVYGDRMLQENSLLIKGLWIAREINGTRISNLYGVNLRKTYQFLLFFFNF